jgi:signal transduction histidine kinase
VDNAIRYTDPGGRARITTRAREDRVEIEVEDTGIGIAAEHQQMVFERFFRVDVVRSRESGGTGLGLSIVRQIVRSLGGDVSLRSTLGEGSTFTITLPRLKQEEAPGV